MSWVVCCVTLMLTHEQALDYVLVVCMQQCTEPLQASSNITTHNTPNTQTPQHTTHNTRNNLLQHTMPVYRRRRLAQARAQQRLDGGGGDELVGEAAAQAALEGNCGTCSLFLFRRRGFGAWLGCRLLLLFSVRGCSSSSFGFERARN